MRNNTLNSLVGFAVMIGGFALADEPSEAIDKKQAEPVPADWFVRDPFPEVGSDFTYGDGVHFLQLASHGAFQGELKLTAEQRKTLDTLRSAHEQLDTQKKQDLIREFGRLPSEEWIKWRTQNWSDARELAGALMGDAARLRVEQLLVQKQGIRFFTDPQMAEKLSLSDAQRTAIRKAIMEHTRRVKKLTADLAAAELGIDKPDAERAAELLRLRKEKSQAGVASFRQNWDDVYHVLTAEQRVKYLEWRGKLLAR